MMPTRCLLALALLCLLLAACGGGDPEPEAPIDPPTPGCQTRPELCT